MSAGLAMLCAASYGSAQNTPLLSGGGGFLTSTKDGATSYLPIVEPLIAAPVGDHLLVESRAALTESFDPNHQPQGGYNHSHFIGLTYLQGDILLNRKMTLVAGSYLTPFNSYNERLSPVWINRFQDGPLIASVGAMGTGTGLGGELRGSAVSNENYSIDYKAYYSVRSGNMQFNSDRSFGGQSSIYFKPQRVEVGLSYGRLLQGTHENFYGMHVWYEPKDTFFRLRSEFARGHHAQGYWIEGGWQLARIGHGEDTWVGRMEPLLRVQQTWRRDMVASDTLPAVNTQELDLGLDYYLPHNLRIMTSYGRQFASTGDHNIVETGITYRFLFPAWRGK